MVRLQLECQQKRAKMKILSTVILGSASLFAASDVINTSCPEMLQGGAVAILGVAVWYLLAKEIPALLKSIEAQRKDFLQSQKESHERYENSLGQITRSIDRLSDAIHLKVSQETHIKNTDPDEQ